jgi:peptidoglycan/LPS O-acetylase OafA/YrhL
MWQRKQTIYLLLVIILMVITGLVVTPATADSFDHFPLPTLCGIVSALALVAIVQFKNRKRQQQLCNTSIICTLCWIGVFCYYHFFAEGQDVSTLPFAAVLPVVTIVCLFLAKAGIKHDEDLIRSMDRIR